MRCVGDIRSALKAPVAFTLVEVLVVISVIAALIATFLPALTAARSQSTAIVCQSNVRQLCFAVLEYATDNKGRFPPNLYTAAPGQFWYDIDHAGKYLTAEATNSSGSYSVWACPNDEGGQLSYAMNVWASSKVDSWVAQEAPEAGVLWSATVRNPSAMILVTEAWSYLGSAQSGWSSLGVLGDPDLPPAPVITPGQRFGVGGGLQPPLDVGHWGLVNCELPFMRHRRSNGSGTRPVGQVSIGYADGHVAMKSNDDLGIAATGLSTLDSWWTPEDPAMNH